MLCADSFLDYLRLEKNYSEETIKSYRCDLKQFDDFLNETAGNQAKAEPRCEFIRSWTVQMMDQGLSASTVNRKLSTLRSYFRFLLKRKEVTEDPTIGLRGPKRKKPIPVFVKESDMDRLLDQEDFGTGYPGIRDHMIIEMFYATGIRLIELIGLNDGDVDLEAMTIKVRGKRNKERLIPFDVNLRNSIVEYLRARKEAGYAPEAFFLKENGRRLNRNDVEVIVRKSLSKVVTQKKRSPHVLRHTFATAMLNHDANLSVIKEILGHASLTSTEIYTHTTFEELIRIYKQAHPRS